MPAGMAVIGGGVIGLAVARRAALDGWSGAPEAGVLDDATLDATNLATVAELVATAALTRTESRGCHRRADHPEPSSDWLGRLSWRLGDDGPQRDWEPLSTHLPADLREDAA